MGFRVRASGLRSIALWVLYFSGLAWMKTIFCISKSQFTEAYLTSGHFLSQVSAFWVSASLLFCFLAFMLESLGCGGVARRWC